MLYSHTASAKYHEAAKNMSLSFIEERLAQNCQALVEDQAARIFDTDCMRLEYLAIEAPNTQYILPTLRLPLRSLLT